VIFVVLVPNYYKDVMFLILYGFHDPSLNKSIVNSRVEYGHFITRIASEFISLLKMIYIYQ
jgi:hypothetical protein